jgi:hypothetical protein
LYIILLVIDTAVLLLRIESNPTYLDMVSNGDEVNNADAASL